MRRFLTAGVLVNGLEEPSIEGTPQGGPLSPLLSNIVLDEFDKELEKRGLRFVRYADDAIIFVRSKRAAERVMESISRFITRRLRLKINPDKAVSPTRGGCAIWLQLHQPTGRLANPHPFQIDQTIQGSGAETHRPKLRVEYPQVIERLNLYLRGWWGYFGITQSLPISDLFTIGLFGVYGRLCGNTGRTRERVSVT